MVHGVDLTGKLPIFQLMMSPVCYFWKTAKTYVLKLFVSHLLVYIVYNISVLSNGAGRKA